MQKIVQKWLFLLIIVISCSKEKNNRPNIDPPKINKNELVNYNKNSQIVKIKLDPKKSKDLIDFNKYFKLEKIINLDNKAVVGTIDKIQFTNNKIIIFDRKNTEQLYCYDLYGNLIWEFKNKGGGPNEYVRLKDFDIDTKQKTVDIWDSRGLKVLKIDIETGNLKGTEKVHTFGQEMVTYKNIKYFYNIGGGFSDSLCFKLIGVNNQNQVVSRLLPYEKIDFTKNSYSIRSLNSSFNKNSLMFSEILNDTIYELKNDELKASYLVDFSNYGVNVKEIKNDKFIENSPILKNKIINFSDKIVFNDDYLIFNYPFKSNSDRYETFRTVLYNRVSREIIHFRRIINSPLTLTKSEQIIFENFDSNDNLVQIIDPMIFNEARQRIKNGVVSEEDIKLFKNKKPELYNLITNSNEYSNPILAFYKLK